METTFLELLIEPPLKVFKKFMIILVLKLCIELNFYSKFEMYVSNLETKLNDIILNLNSMKRWKKGKDLFRGFILMVENGYGFWTYDWTIKVWYIETQKG